MHLLDTHILIWAMDRPDRLKPNIREILERSFEVYVSPLSIFEIKHKAKLGKLKLKEDPTVMARKTQFHFLPVEINHIEAAVSLPLHHRDPFDRLLMGQALAERLTFITSDRMIMAYDRDVKLLQA